MREVNYSYIDTTRIIAAFMVILSHYAWFFNFEKLNFIYNAFAGNGLSNFVFMAVSGFLAAHSLSRDNNVFLFYKSRLSRIVIPYFFTYILLSAVFILLACLNSKFLNHVALSHVIFSGGSYKSFILGMFPIDLNLLHWLNLKPYIFIGEWFIGALVILYFISPVLYFLINKLKWKSLFIILLLAVVLNQYKFFNTYLFMNTAAFFWGYHILDYFLGFLIYIYMPKAKINSKIVIGAILFVTFLFLFHIFYYDEPTFRDKIGRNYFQYMFVGCSFTCMVFLLSKYLNEKFNFSKFNSFSKYSYCFLLMQHVIIYTVMDFFSSEKYSKFGALFFFLLIVFVTGFLAVKFTNYYKPYEDKIVDKIKKQYSKNKLREVQP